MDYITEEEYLVLYLKYGKPISYTNRKTIKLAKTGILDLAKGKVGIKSNYTFTHNQRAHLIVDKYIIEFPGDFSILYRESVTGWENAGQRIKNWK